MLNQNQFESPTSSKNDLKIIFTGHENSRRVFCIWWSRKKCEIHPRTKSYKFDFPRNYQETSSYFKQQLSGQSDGFTGQPMIKKSIKDLTNGLFYVEEQNFAIFKNSFCQTAECNQPTSLFTTQSRKLNQGVKSQSFELFLLYINPWKRHSASFWTEFSHFESWFCPTIDHLLISAFRSSPASLNLDTKSATSSMQVSEIMLPELVGTWTAALANMVQGQK